MEPMQDEVVYSSEEEQERIEEEKERYVATVALTGVTGPVRNVLVCAAGNAQALTKILFEGMAEAGKAEVLYQEKTKEVLKIFYVQASQLLVLHPEGLKGAWSRAVISQLFTKLAETGSPTPRVVILDTVYKTNYSTTDTGHLLSLDDGFPLKYYKSSHVDAHAAAFLSKHQPAGVLNILGGFAAALLVHAELSGQSAVAIHAIVDSHYVTAETLQAFSTVVTDLLQISGSGVDQVARLPAFKKVLKEANTRSNNIFN